MLLRYKTGLASRHDFSRPKTGWYSQWYNSFSRMICVGSVKLRSKRYVLQYISTRLTHNRILKTSQVQLFKTINIKNAAAIGAVQLENDHWTDPTMIYAARRSHPATLQKPSLALSNVIITIGCHQGYKLSHGNADLSYCSGLNVEISNGGSCYWRALNLLIVQMLNLPVFHHTTRVW